MTRVTGSNLVSAAVLTFAAGVACSSPAAADQIGESRQPGINMRVGGVRASMPGPSMSPRKGSLLNRPSPILPPTPRVAAPSNVARPPAAVPGTGGGLMPNRPAFGGGFDKPCYVPSTGNGDDGGTVIGNNGSTISGATASDRFRLRFHVGAGGHHHHDDCHPHDHPHHGHVPTWYGYWNNYGWWYNRPSVIYSGPWYGNDPFVANGQSTGNTATTSTTAATTQTAPRALTPIELADLYWQDGRLDQAAAQFNSYFRTAPDDTDAMRYMAVLLIDQKKVDEAVAMLAMAYQKTPQLAARPLPAAEIPGGLRQMRQRVNLLSAHANKVKTGSAWLAMAVLVQSEDRAEIARMLTERAGAAGLDETVKNEMLAALK